MAAQPRPTREELRALHRRYRESKDPAERDRIREQLVNAYHDFVYFLARKFQNRGEPLDDIVQVGARLLPEPNLRLVAHELLYRPLRRFARCGVE